LKIRKIDILNDYHVLSTKLLNRNTYHLSKLNLKYFYEYHKNVEDISLLLEVNNIQEGLIPLFKYGKSIISPFGYLKFIWKDKDSESKIDFKALTSDLKGRISNSSFELLPSSKMASAFLKNTKLKNIYNSHVDLNLTEEEILLSIKNTVRADIRWGLKNLKILIINKQNYSNEKIIEVMNFHIEQAGRETRSEESWRLQGEMIKNGEAYLVNGFIDSKLVSSSLNLYGDEEAFYGVGVYDKELMSIKKYPLTHAIVLKSIYEAKFLGLKKFNFGRLELESDNKKIVGISKFKLSMSSDLELKGVLCNE
jgi:hypothetical protein